MTIPTDAQIRRLQATLDSRATEKSRIFWTRYLKGNATFRGVPMGALREVIHAWWHDEGLDDLATASRIRAALRLFEEEPTEDKLASVLVLSEILLPHLSKKDLPAFARLFARSHISNWHICDWFCVKVLGRMVECAEAPCDLAEAISAWRTSRPLWQRRATCVAFVNHAKYGDKRIPGLSRIIFRNAAALVCDQERFAHTGVGWVLRELSLAQRAAVITFAEENARQLSREGMRYITEKMPAADREHLLGLQIQHRRSKKAGKGSQ